MEGPIIIYIMSHKLCGYKQAGKNGLGVPCHLEILISC